MLRIDDTLSLCFRWNSNSPFLLGVKECVCVCVCVSLFLHIGLALWGCYLSILLSFLVLWGAWAFHSYGSSCELPRFWDEETKTEAGNPLPPSFMLLWGLIMMGKVCFFILLLSLVLIIPDPFGFLPSSLIVWIPLIYVFSPYLKNWVWFPFLLLDPFL